VRPVIDELYRTTPNRQRPDANDLAAKVYDALDAAGAEVPSGGRHALQADQPFQSACGRAAVLALTYGRINARAEADTLGEIENCALYCVSILDD
jgi:hypothetical protein